MKNLFILLFLSITSLAFSQTTFMMVSSHPEGPATLSSFSANNPWVGAKLAYNVSGDVSESFILSARALYVAAAGDKWAVPILGNVGLNQPDSLSSDAGVSLGAYPWYTLSHTGNLQLLLHGGLSYHILDRADSGVGNQFRILAGFQAALYGVEGGSPTVLSIAPEYIMNTGISDDSSWGLAISGVVPVANGLGVLMEGNIPFDGQMNTGLKIGVIVNGVIR